MISDKEKISLLERELLNIDKRILFFGGHCDDIELFCGKLILKRKGDRKYDPNARALITSAGNVKPWITRLAVYAYNGATGSPEVRMAESMEAMENLGVMEDKLKFLPYPQLALHRFPECVDDLLRTIRNVNPDYIVVPSYEGGHVDHDTTNLFAWLAVLISGINPNRIIEYAGYRFEPNSSRMIIQDFVPKNGFPSFDFVSDAGIQSRWREIMGLFRSQRNKRVEISLRSNHESYRIYPEHDYGEFAFPLTGKGVRQLLEWAPVNLAALFLKKSERTPYDDPKYWLTLTPANVLKEYSLAINRYF